MISSDEKGRVKSEGMSFWFWGEMVLAGDLVGGRWGESD